MALTRGAKFLLVCALVLVGCTSSGGVETTSTSGQSGRTTMAPTTTTTPGPTSTAAVTTSTTTLDEPGEEVAPSTTVPSGPTSTVMTYDTTGFPCDFQAVLREVHTIDATVDPIVAALELQLDKWTGDDPGSLVRSVQLQGGLLTVDFEDLREVLENASTTDASCALLAELSAVVFQFDDVQRVTYQIEGSCEAFFGWLQRDPCLVYQRD